MSEQSRAINKSEVYSHYLGLLFCGILALTADWRWWRWDGVRVRVRVGVGRGGGQQSCEDVI